MQQATSLPTVQLDDQGRPYLVRPYSRSDRLALEDMYRSFQPKRVAQGLPPHGLEGIRRWLDRVLATGVHIVVETGGRIMGHVMLMPQEDNAVELANFLHQSVRGRGIGTRLNQMAVDLARDAGLERVWLSVEPANRAAIRSYEKAGFRQLPGSLWTPEIEMEVRLTP
jgi:RimJ/RimL family protein N-acetyltransferase